MTIAWKQDLKCFGEGRFTVSFMHLKLRRERKEDYLRVGESQVDYRIVMVMHFLEDNCGLFQRCVHLDTQKQCTGLA